MSNDKFELEDLSKKAEYYKSELNALVQEMARQENTEEIKKIKYSFGKIRKNIVLFVTSASVALGLVAGSVPLAKKLATTYETITTIYDPKLEEQKEPTIEYTTAENIGIYLCEYQPYVKTDSGFERKVLRYDVSALESLTDDEYFDLDFEALDIKAELYTEPKSKLNPQDLYTESYSALKKVQVNPENTDGVVSSDWPLYWVLLLGCSWFIELALEAIYCYLKLNEREKSWGVIDSIYEIRKHYQNIKASKLSMKEKEEALNVLKEKAYRLYQENQEIINRLQALIFEANFNPAELEELQNNLSRIRELNKYVNELSSIVQEMARQETTEETKKIKYSFGKIRKNIVLFATSASVAIGLTAGSIAFSKKITATPTYETTTTIYNPKLEEQEEPTVEYTTTKNDSTYLCEYQPYVETDSGFKREILTYDVSNFEGLTDDEYFDFDFETLGIEPSSSFEPKSALSLEDLYTESYSVLKKAHVNPEKTDSEVSSDWPLFCLLLLIVCTSRLNVRLELLFTKHKFNERGKTLGFIDSIYEIRKYYQNIKASKLNMKEKEEALNVLKEKAYRLYQENQEIINHLQTLISEANFNSSFAPELEQVQNNLSRIRELNKKVQD